MEIPTFTNRQAVAVYQGPRADPGAMAAPGQALARLGETASDVFAAFGERYGRARQQAEASSKIAQSTEQLGQLQFELSKTPDRNAAMEQFQKRSDELRANILKDVKDNEVANAIVQRFDQEAKIRKLDTGNAAFQAESQMRRGELATNLLGYAKSAAATTNPLLRAKIQDDAIGSIRGSVAAGWLNPEAGSKAELEFKSDVEENRVVSALNDVAIAGDTDKAEALIGAIGDANNFKDLSPDKREAFITRAEALSYRLMQRDAAKAAKADTEAARALRQTQTENETKLLTDIHTGKPVDPAQIEALAYGNKLSPEGVRAIYTAIDRQGAGKDDPIFATRLWQRIGERTASPDDIYAGINAHRIRTETATEMMRALYTRDRTASDQVERGRFNELKTALSGAAVESGIIPDKSPQVQLWLQAQGEWNRRVVAGSEDPSTVLQDMLPRYQKAMPTLEGLPRPRFGVVTSQQELNAAGAATVRAFQSRQIDQATYDEEVRLLNRYKAFLADQQQRQPQKAPAK